MSPSFCTDGKSFDTVCADDASKLSQLNHTNKYTTHRRWQLTFNNKTTY